MVSVWLPCIMTWLALATLTVDEGMHQELST